MPSKSSLVPDFLGQLVDGGRLRLDRVLGSGAYGVCYEARSFDKEGPTTYAVKCLIKTGLDERQRTFQKRELKLHAMASAHPGKAILQTTYIVFILITRRRHSSSCLRRRELRLPRYGSCRG